MQNNFKRTCLTYSDSASLNFNFSKCKAQRITRKLKTVIFVYHMDGSQLEVLSAEKDLVVYITDNLTWNKQVWTPQSIDLIQKPERVQRRATKYILDLRTIHLRPDKKERAAYHPSPIGTGF